VAELMGGIVAGASGTSISKEVEATIDAVKSATAGLGTDEGATADKIAKLLKLDTSSAWRRLRVAMNKGFVVNLETRHRQPGRYRLTDQEVEAEPLLPSPEAIAECAASGGPKMAQTPKRTQNDEAQQGDNACTDDCKRDANADAVCANDEAVCNPHANAHENAKAVKNKEKRPPFTRLHGFQGGEREKTVCQACDGLGCPTCQPKKFGIGV
jgi:hypothetical protein